MYDNNIREFLSNLPTNMSLYSYDLAVLTSEDALSHMSDLAESLKYNNINITSKSIDYKDVINQYEYIINNIIYRGDIIAQMTDTNSQVVIKQLVEYIIEYTDSYIRSVIEGILYSFNNIIRLHDVSQLTGDVLSDYNRYCKNDISIVIENSLPDISFTLIPSLTDKVDKIMQQYMKHTISNDMVFNIWSKAYMYVYYTVYNNPYFIVVPMMWIKNTVKIFIVQLEGVKYG